VGALTSTAKGQQAVEFAEVGKISVFDNCAYVAVHKQAAKLALQKISEGKMKGRSFRVRRIRG